jgi:hypothetical protein
MLNASQDDLRVCAGRYASGKNSNCDAIRIEFTANECFIFQLTAQLRQSDIYYEPHGFIQFQSNFMIIFSSAATPQLPFY